MGIIFILVVAGIKLYDGLDRYSNNALLKRIFWVVWNVFLGFIKNNGKVELKHKITHQCDMQLKGVDH